MSFKFEFELGQSEQIRASRVMAHRRWDTRIAYLMVVICVAAVVACWAYWDSQGWDVPFRDFVVLLGVASAVFVGVYLSPYLMVRNLRRNNRAAAGPHIYFLSDSGLEAISPGARSTLEWANVAEAYETKEFLLFYVSKGYALLLPKRIVTSEALPRLRFSLRSWLGPRASLLADPSAAGTDKHSGF